MANSQPALLSFSMVDELGTKASISYKCLLDPAMTITNINAVWAAHAAALDDILGAQIIDGSLAVSPTPTQLAAAVTKTAPAAGSRVEQTGVFDMKNGANSTLYGIAVAGLSDDVIDAGRIVIAEDGVVDVWLDLVEAAGTATTPQFTNAQYQALLAVGGLADAFVSFRKRRKQLTRSSRELGPD